MTEEVNMAVDVDHVLRKELEDFAVSLAWGAGSVLMEYFSGTLSANLNIEYKDKNQKDPVTSADKTTQDYLINEISDKFPEHGILGEEDSKDSGDDALVPDFLWVLDPLDGTTNFLNGLPIFASSIGLLYKGWPLIAALYIPWPNSRGGFVLHCHRGGGCYADDGVVTVYETAKPAANRLIGLPGYFAQGMRFSKNIKGSPGELRTTGSIAYELAMTACGILQYAVIGAPRMWDMLAGALAVQEAGGTIMIRLPGEKLQEPMGSLYPDYYQGSPTFKQLRNWIGPLIGGNRQLAPLIAQSIHRKSSMRSVVKMTWLNCKHIAAQRAKSKNGNTS